MVIGSLHTCAHRIIRTNVPKSVCQRRKKKVSRAEREKEMAAIKQLEDELDNKQNADDKNKNLSPAEKEMLDLEKSELDPNIEWKSGFLC